jgi:hypothetical protein
MRNASLNGDLGLANLGRPPDRCWLATGDAPTDLGQHFSIIDNHKLERQRARRWWPERHAAEILTSVGQRSF